MTTSSPVVAAPAEPNSSTNSPGNESAPRSRRWGLIGLVLLTLLGGGLWFTPELVSRTALRQEVPKYLFPFFPGRIDLGETSLSWTGPVVIRGIEIFNSEGERLVSIAEFRSESPLWQIIAQRDGLGRFHLEGCKAHVLTNGEVTNFDETIAAFQGAPPVKKQPSCELIFHRLQVALQEAGFTDIDQLPPINSQLQIGMREAHSIDITIQVGIDEASAGELEIRISSNVSPDAPTTTVEITAEHWQLAQLRPVLRRWLGPGEIWGELHGTATWNLADATLGRWTLQHDLQVHRLEILKLPALQSDQFRLEQMSLVGELSGTHDMVACQQLQFDSPVAACQVTGSWTREQLQQLASMSWLPEQDSLSVAVIDEDFQLAGWIDAAAIARQLPHTLQLKDRTEITQGKLTFRADSRLEAAQRIWISELKLDELAAQVDNVPWSWKSPLSADLRISRGAEGLVCDRLLVESDFFQAQARGTASQAKLTASADLDRLSKELAAIVDWGTTRVSGVLRATAEITDRESAGLSLVSTANVERLTLGEPQQPWLSEPQLTLQLTATANGPRTAPWTQLDVVDLDVTAGEDRLVLDVQALPDSPSDSTARQIRGELQGDLARWGRRLSPLLPEAAAGLQGSGQITLNGRWSPDSISIERGTLSAKPFRYASADWRIDEPEFQLQTAGTWSTSKRVWSTPATTLVGSFGRFDWTNTSVQLTEATYPTLAGDCAFDVDVGRISQWRAGQIDRHLLGKARGVLRLRSQETLIGLALDTQVQNLMYVSLQPLAGSPAVAGPIPAEWVTQWKEPAAQLQMQARWDSQSNQLEFRNLSFAGEGLAIAGTARAQWESAGWNFETGGQLDYDWSRLSARMDPATAEKYQLTGTGSKPFQLKGRWQQASESALAHGPVGPGNELTGTAALGWDSLRMLGITVGPAEIVGQFQGATGSIQPLQLAVAEGTLNLAPQFRFQPGPVTIIHPAGRIADRIRLSPDLCRDSLKYVAPLLVDAAEVDGRFSLELLEGSWPAAEYAAGTASGRLEIHGAQLKPGASLARVFGLVEQVRAIVENRESRGTNPDRLLVELPEQVVQFRQGERRMAHDRLVIRSRDVEIQTRGSVGFDETLNLVASIPLRSEWISNERLRDSLGGQLLEIPIRGTLRQPQVDPGVLANLARKAATGRIEQVIDGKLRDQLNRLLPR